MRVAIGCDQGGYELKQTIIELLQNMDIEFKDFGTYTKESIDYPDFAFPVSEAIANGEYDRGILICGTGIGMSIAANKVEGIRAALVHDLYTAKVTREHNDSNVLCMGGRVIGPVIAEEITKIWLTTDFEGGRHGRRVNKMMGYKKNK